MTGASDAPIQADDDVAETRIRPCQRSQPLQSLAPDLQGTTLRRVGGVADPRELSRHISRQRSIMWRAVRVGLTAPVDVMRDAAVAGLGIACLPIPHAERQLVNGTLVEVLAG